MDKLIRKFSRTFWSLALPVSFLATFAVSNTNAAPFEDWKIVINNDDIAPGSTKTFFSYNPPSINNTGTVVVRARAKTNMSSESTLEGAKGKEGGGGQGGIVSGIFTRDMSSSDSEIIAVAVKDGVIPHPNNIENPGLATFNEFPSFPRIDATSNFLAFRAQSQPSWNVVISEGEETRSGTSGLYVAGADSNTLQTGIRNIEAAEGFPEYLVPDTSIRFEQFPGAPSPTKRVTTDSSTGAMVEQNLLTFKGNWTDADGNGQTGIFYRDISAGDGTSPVVAIAKRGDLIPTEAVQEGTGPVYFGSTAPPSAAAGKVVFTGLDNENNPSAGGIFLADLTENPTLSTVAGFNTAVPIDNTPTLNTFGEALSFDGRFVGFWAGWGDEYNTIALGSEAEGNYEVVNVIKNQGIFLADTLTEQLFLVAQAGEGQLFSDFLFWNYSGKSSDMGSDEGDEGEGQRWRSSAFFAVDEDDIVFKAVSSLTGETGLYGALDVTDPLFDYSDLITIIETGMNGGLLDPMANNLPITSLSLERDSFRKGQLAISASMTDGENSWAGVYVATTPTRGLAYAASGAVPTPEPSTILLFGAGLLLLSGKSRRFKR